MDGALQARYWYDAGGRRVKLGEGADSILHVYSGMNTIYEVNGSSITKHYYARAVAGPVGLNPIKVQNYIFKMSNVDGVRDMVKKLMESTWIQGCALEDMYSLRT
jgi:hypothetical protein